MIRNKLIVDEGDPLNNLLFNKSINDIRSLGILKKLAQKLKMVRMKILKSLI